LVTQPQRCKRQEQYNRERDGFASNRERFVYQCRHADAIEEDIRTTMSLRINSEAPDFIAETTQGTIGFHDWIGSSWAILFSHPKDFTPVCTTELGYMAGLKPEFDKRSTKIIGLSVDPVDNHARWAEDIEETQGHAVNYPMIGDTELKVAKAYDMLPRVSARRAVPRRTMPRCGRCSSLGPTRRSRRC
jgi:peroxiredoxin